MSIISEEEKADTVVEIEPLFTIDPLKFCEKICIPVASAEAVSVVPVALAETMTEPEFKNRPAVGTERDPDPPPKITPCASASADE